MCQVGVSHWLAGSPLNAALFNCQLLLLRQLVLPDIQAKATLLKDEEGLLLQQQRELSALKSPEPKASVPQPLQGPADARQS